jgi:MMP 1-O-methyltransferase
MTYEDIQGYFNFEQIYDNAVARFDNGVFVELGAWKGKSTAYMGKILKENGRTGIKFYSIDNFEASESAPFMLKMLEEMKTPLFKEYHNNLIACGVAEFVNPIVSDSASASENFNDGAVSFCFIDADHAYEPVKKDLESWYPKMINGGLFAGHDYTNAKGVKKAVDEFTEKHSLTLSFYRNSWIIQL